MGKGEGTFLEKGSPPFPKPHPPPSQDFHPYRIPVRRLSAWARDSGGAVFLIKEKNPKSSLPYFIIEEKRRGHVLAFSRRKDGVFPSFSSMKRTNFQFVSLRIRCKRTPWKQKGTSPPLQEKGSYNPHFPPTGQTCTRKNTPPRSSAHTENQEEGFDKVESL